MRFHPTIAEDRKRLRRLAALLCALAELAERAAGRSRAVCCLVLWLIRPAEAVACDYVDRIAPGASRLPEPIAHGDSTAEVLRLAQCFRWLAAILAALADHCRAPLLDAPANHVQTTPARRPAWTVAIAKLDSS